MPLRYNLHIHQGETFELTVPVVPGDPNTPASLFGLAATAQIRADPASGVVLHEWSEEEGNVTLTDDGDIVLNVPAAVSSTWLWRRGVWSLELADPDNGATVRLAEGWVFVTPEITR